MAHTKKKQTRWKIGLVATNAKHGITGPVLIFVKNHLLFYATIVIHEVFF